MARFAGLQVRQHQACELRTEERGCNWEAGRGTADGESNSGGGSIVGGTAGGGARGNVSTVHVQNGTRLGSVITGSVGVHDAVLSAVIA